LTGRGTKICASLIGKTDPIDAIRVVVGHTGQLPKTPSLITEFLQLRIEYTFPVGNILFACEHGEDDREADDIDTNTHGKTQLFGEAFSKALRLLSNPSYDSGLRKRHHRRPREEIMGLPCIVSECYEAAWPP